MGHHRAMRHLGYTRVSTASQDAQLQLDALVDSGVQKRDVFAKYGDQARAVLNALLEKYADEGVLNLDDTNVLRIPPLNTLGTPVQLINAFGGKAGFEDAVHSLQNELYQDVA